MSSASKLLDHVIYERNLSAMRGISFSFRVTESSTDDRNSDCAADLVKEHKTKENVGNIMNSNKEDKINNTLKAEIIEHLSP